jgi:HEAT repeat protein
MTPPSPPEPDPDVGGLSHPDPQVRGRTVDALAERPGARSRELLRQRLADDDWVVRFKAAAALAWMGDDAGVGRLVEALAQRELCFMALQALAALGSPTSLPALERFFRRRFLHPLERMQAAAALVRCGDESAADWLARRLESHRPEERGFALELWGRLGRPDARQRLEAVLADPVDPHRLDAVRGLAQLGDRAALALLRRVAAEPGDAELAAEARAAAEWLEESAS